MRVAFGWVYRAAAVLRNKKGLDAAGVRRRYRGLIGAMARHRETCGGLRVALEHFRKVTRSYWPGLFRCHEVEDLPRANDDLEQSFGSYRYHERRASGRKVASPATVLRGSARLIAATATRLHPPTARELGGANRKDWAELRKRLEQRRHARVLRTRFRRNPQQYLAELEQLAHQSGLPP